MAHALVALGGAAMLTWFIRKQLSAARPMVDMRLFTHRIILSGVMMAMTAPITLVGFELLMARLQFVHQENAVRGGDIYAAGNGGQRLQRPDCRPAGVAAGCARWRPAGCCSAPSAFSAALTRISVPSSGWPGADDAAGLWRGQRAAGLQFRDYGGSAEGESGGRGAIETMAYELGAGLGIALFGLILTRSYSASIALPSGLSGAMAQQAASSIGEAVSLSQALPGGGAGADGSGEDGFYSGS